MHPEFPRFFTSYPGLQHPMAMNCRNYEEVKRYARIFFPAFIELSITVDPPCDDGWTLFDSGLAELREKKIGKGKSMIPGFQIKSSKSNIMTVEVTDEHIKTPLLNEVFIAGENFHYAPRVLMRDVNKAEIWLSDPYSQNEGFDYYAGSEGMIYGAFAEFEHNHYGFGVTELYGYDKPIQTGLQIPVNVCAKGSWDNPNRQLITMIRSNCLNTVARPISGKIKTKALFTTAFIAWREENGNRVMDLPSSYLIT